MDLESIWNSFLEKIKGQMNDISYETWFKEAKLISLDNNLAKISVPTIVHKKQLADHYIDLIEENFTELTGTNFKFEFCTEDELTSNIVIDTNEIGVSEKFKSGLNPDYNFDTFIVGNSNKFAAVSALAVAEQPGNMYNPFFIYGSSGLGKTHLMHAIGNYIVQNSNKRVLYIPCDKFVDEFVEMCRKNNNGDNKEAVREFKDKYRDVDVLIIDDIQNIVTSVFAQQEFFNTFNELYNNRKQIIISSDRSPEDIKKLEERLKTRFKGGLQVDILPPEFELRMNILNKKLEQQGISNDFPEDVKEYIASNCAGDIRTLEGAIVRVYAYSACMGGEDITLDLAVEALQDHFSVRVVAKNKIDQVIQLVSDNYKISPEDLKSKKKTSEIAIPRMIAMYICRVYLEENLTKIGIEFGGKNHTTVMHAVNKIKNEILKDEALNNEIQKIINRIK